MSIYKRIGSLILSLLLVFSMFGSTFAIQTFAATTTVLSTESKSVSAGEQFTVAVNLSNATSVYDGNFTLQYDSSLLTADSYSFGSIVNEHNKSCNLDYQSAGNLIRMTFYGTSSISANGTLVTITFTAKEDVSGTAALQFTNYKMYDLNGSSVTTTANGSNITITGEPVISPTISVANKTVTVGDTFSVPVLISDSESVYDGNFTLQYDSDLLTVNSYSYGSVVDSHNKNCNLDYQSAGNLIRFTFNGTSALSSDGTLVTFNFTAKSEGTAALKFTEYKMYDKDGSSISTTFSNANITVKPLNDNIVTGQCGDDVYYELDINSGELIISGTGDMWDYDYTWGANNKYIYSVKIESGVTGIGKEGFSYCSNLESVELPDSMCSIGYGAFIDCSNLTSINIPKKISYIGSNAFFRTKNLLNVYISDLEAWCNIDFDGSSSNPLNCGANLYLNDKLVTELIISEKISEIPQYAFDGCNSINSVTFSQGVTDIGKYAFYNCGSLEQIKWTNTIKSVGEYAFADSVYIKDVYIEDLSAWCNIVFGGDSANPLYQADNLYLNDELITELIIPNDITVILPYAFSGCGCIKSISFPDNLIEIGKTAFWNCSGISNIIIPNKVEKIDTFAFAYCYLESITIPESVVEIGNNILQGNTGVTMYGYTDSFAEDYAIENDIKFISFDKEIAFGQCGDDLYYSLKENGNLVISGTGAMWDFTTFNAPWYENYADSIKTIEIQDSVTTIGSAAFSYCYYLTDVKFGNGLKHIGSGAFSHSSSLSSVVLPYGIESVGDWAFEYCNDLSEIVLPDTIKSIGEDICDVTSFHSNDANWTGDVLYIGKHLVDTKFPYTGECIIKDGTLTIADGVFHQSNLTSVIIPNSVTYIGESAFSCTELTSVTIPSSVKEIKTNTFYHCLSLERVTITNGTEIIGSSAFYYCPALTTITIPISVTYIGESAFVLCENLKTVVYNGSQYGSQEEWNLIEICENNDELLKVKPQTVTKVIDSMEINSNPEKSTYYIGDSLSTSGLKLLVTYSDGTTETITSGFTTSGFSSTAAGTKTVTVSYEGFTDTFTVTVKTPSITLSSSSKTMSIGDTSTITATTTPSGQAVTWTSSNTSVATVSGGKITAKTSGSTTITAKFTYNGKTYSKTCSVTVEDVPVPPTPESLSVSTKPTKTTYEIGESLNTSGLKLKLTYSDGSTETITSGFTTSGFSSTTAGTKTVTVKYSGLSTTFTVTVTSTPDPTPTSLSVSTKPTKTTYEIGESLNTSGLKLKLTYSDGSTETITSGFTTSGFSSTTAGTKTVTVKYSGLTTTFTVTVNVPEPDIDENAPQIVVESTKARAGETVSVTISLKNNPGIASLKLKVSYDASLTLTEIVYNNEIGGQFTFPQTMVSPATLNWVNATEDSEGDWTFATLTFKVSENAEAGNCPISITYDPDDVYDLTETNIEFAVVNGSIDVIEYISGDINGDSKVNNKDATRLLQYLSDWNVEVVEAALDVNGDGKVNNKDATRLLQYLSDWDVEIY